MDFATSPDLGRTWLNTWGQTIANTTAERPILPGSAGITVFSIPKYGCVREPSRLQAFSISTIRMEKLTCVL